MKHLNQIPDNKTVLIKNAILKRFKFWTSIYKLWNKISDEQRNDTIGWDGRVA